MTISSQVWEDAESNYLANTSKGETGEVFGIWEDALEESINTNTVKAVQLDSWRVSISDKARRALHKAGYSVPHH